MKVLIFHGYLLSGTGSNVYNARLAAALAGMGHEVHLLCQDRHPEEQSFVDAVGRWEGGRLTVRAVEAAPRVQGSAAPAGPEQTAGTQGPERAGARGRRGRCTVYRPDIGGLLPVYVEDHYEGIEARSFERCSDAELARYLDANVGAVAEVVALAGPEVGLANHLIMGPVVLARGLPASIPYAVAVHGSALEYTVRPHPERFLAFAREGLARARGVLVGSRHTAESLWEVIGDPELRELTRLGPPGVDVTSFRPRASRQEANEALEGLVARLRRAAPPGSVHPSDRPDRDTFARDELEAAEALERLDPGRDRLVVFVGKLIVSKGIDLLIAAWPLVLQRVPEARLVIVGFGAYREGVRALIDGLAEGDLRRVRSLALAGRELERESGAVEEHGPVAGPQGSGAHPLRYLSAFLDELARERLEAYLTAARQLRGRVLLTGRLEHPELAELLPSCEALVVPSTFPEAFGMVAVEGAACGVFPVSAAHSGLAEVSRALAGALPAPAVPWLSFPLQGDVVSTLAERILSWLTAPEALRARVRTALVAEARERWSWEGVGRTVIAAAMGDLDRLPRP
jgi:glycosyltransferase involved in cell wall biosynthesis